MKPGCEIELNFSGLFLIHQNLPERLAEMHVHEEHQFFLVVSGQVKLISTENVFEVSEGGLVFVPGGLPRSFESTDAVQGERVIGTFDSTRWGETLGPVQQNVVSCTASQLFREFTYLLLTRDPLKTDPCVLDLYMEILSEQISKEGLRSFESLEKAILHIRDPRLRKAVTYMQTHFFEEIAILNIAKAVNISERALQRLFAEKLDLTPKQLLTQLRVEEARKLLRETRLTITDIAFEAGFGSLSRFIDSFRKSTGQLPSDFRKSLRVGQPL
jgi:AraC-like DNA-binding protein